MERGQREGKQSILYSNTNYPIVMLLQAHLILLHFTDTVWFFWLALFWYLLYHSGLGPVLSLRYACTSEYVIP